MYAISESLSEFLADVFAHADNIAGSSHADNLSIEGIAVSYSATQGSHSRKKLNRVVRHALHHDGYVGGWLDAADSLYYFDSTRLFPEDSLDAAIKFGAKNKQKAIYSIKEGKEIKLK